MKTKTALKTLFSVIALFIVVVLLINTAPFDEKLNPEVVEILQSKPMPVAQGNAYFALIGIKTELENNITDAGFKIIQEHIKQQGNILTTPESNNVDSNWMINYQNNCNSKNNNDCLIQLKQQISEHPIDNKRLKLMLSRYQKIIAMPMYRNYQEPKFNIYMPTNQYSIMMKLSKIYIASNYQVGSALELLKILDTDLKFWKMMLNDSTYLIDKMVALNAIRSDIYTLSTLIRDNDNFSELELSLIQTILNPLSAEELDLTESFIAESRVAFKLFESFGYNDSFFDNLFYQPNATLNEYYEQNIKEQKKYSKLSLGSLIDTRTLEKQTAKSTRFNILKFSNLYNFHGKMLVAYSGCACSDYVVRGYDLNNIIKMVDIQLQTKLSSFNKVEQIITKSKNINPFNNKKFDYDSSAKILKFDCLDQYSQCSIKI